VDIRKLVRPNIRSLKAYEAKEVPCKIKLDANESPYSAFSIQRSDDIKEIYQVLNRYPDPEAKYLKKIVSKYFGVKSQNILQGNGSDELIYYLITTFGGPVLYPVPTFSMYGIIAKAIGEKTIEIPLDKEFDLDFEKIFKAIKKHKPKLIFLSTPNNPTGNCFSSEKVLKIIEISALRLTYHSSLIVIDEAYQPFSSKMGFIPFLKDYKNLVIMRTLSKIGLAGLRIGFILADEKIIKEVNKVRLPFNVNSISQRIAVEALKDRKTLQRHIKAIISERENLFNELAKIDNIKPYPSEANFILFRVKDSERIYQSLLSKGILIRNMKGIVDGCLRVTVGTPEENRIFLKYLRSLTIL
jgi:histidinol-phosphate aminotransferase